MGHCLFFYCLIVECDESNTNNINTKACFDANLQHDLITVSAMGTFHRVQETVVNFSSKRQSIEETAIYATEFIAGQMCLGEATAIHYKLQNWSRAFVSDWY
jgi:hypothetical protein